MLRKCRIHNLGPCVHPARARWLCAPRPHQPQSRMPPTTRPSAGVAILRCAPPRRGTTAPLNHAVYNGTTLPLPLIGSEPMFPHRATRRADANTLCPIPPTLTAVGSARHCSFAARAQIGRASAHGRDDCRQGLRLGYLREHYPCCACHGCHPATFESKDQASVQPRAVPNSTSHGISPPPIGHLAPIPSYHQPQDRGMMPMSAATIIRTIENPHIHPIE